MGALVVPASTHENQASELMMDHLIPKASPAALAEPLDQNSCSTWTTEDGIRGSVHTTTV